MNKRVAVAVLLIAGIVLRLCPMRGLAADRQYRWNIPVTVDGELVGEIAAFDKDYENNLYLSVTGLAVALQGTEKAFAPTVERRRIVIETARDPGSTAAAGPAVWTEELMCEVGTASSAKYELWVDGTERKYYSYILAIGERYDAFLTPVSLSMLLDLHMEVTEDGVEIRTAEGYSFSAEEMEASGYLQGVNALVIGDAAEEEIFYGFNRLESVPIASTTKLMTYLVFMDAVERGECAEEDRAVISEKAARLSNGSDGVIPMSAGMTVPVRELLYGMLLPSSNECALALAEHVAGSEEAFVERMNAKAEELGLESARFYNCHGLPSYEDQLAPAKLQNHMTGEELFRLAAVILERYPQITEITSARQYRLETLNRDVKNTNPILYNMDGAVGLKTGTTNKAGACLVTCVAAEKNGETHNLLVVMLGAEGDESRGIVSEMGARYAVEELKTRAPREETGEEVESEEGIPEDPELVVRALLERILARECPADGSAD